MNDTIEDLYNTWRIHPITKLALDALEKHKQSFFERAMSMTGEQLKDDPSMQRMMVHGAKTVDACIKMLGDPKFLIPDDAAKFIKE